VIPTVFGTVSDQRSVRRTHPRGVSNIRPSQFVQRPLGSPRPMIVASPCPDWPTVRCCDSVPIRPILPIRPRRGCLTLCWKHSGIHLSRNRPPQDRPPCPRFSGDHRGSSGKLQGRTDASRPREGSEICFRNSDPHGAGSPSPASPRPYRYNATCNCRYTSHASRPADGMRPKNLTRPWPNRSNRPAHFRYPLTPNPWTWPASRNGVFVYSSQIRTCLSPCRG